MEKPTVSVIVTTYNRETYLKETIQSILDQTYTDFELIVVDNFSNYDFFKVIEEFGDERVRPFQNQNNGIIAVNRNYGIKQARGQYLAFCDDDDLWMSEKLEKQVKVLKENCDIDLICSKITRFSNTIDAGRNKSEKDKMISLRGLLRKNIVATSTVILKHKENVFFNESSTLLAVEDYDLWIRLHLDGCKMFFMGEPLLYYREAFQNTSNGKNKILLPIRRISMLSAIRVKYNIGNGRYVFYVLYNLVELVAKLIVKR